jgi:hypothetical protein
LWQLNDAIEREGAQIAVYYDRNGLQPGTESDKLDVRRIPTSCPLGCFHSKNVLVLVEDKDPRADGSRPLHLIVAALSANLSRSGWWENVEVAHIEHVAEGEACQFRDDLLSLMSRIRKFSSNDQEHTALGMIHGFARKLDSAGEGTSTHRRLYTSSQSVPNFLHDVLGEKLHGLNLEIVSPYFDGAHAKPIIELIEQVRPSKVRVFLPRNDAGAALCSPDYFATVSQLAGVKWGHLPTELLRKGKSKDAAQRFVHAKVYRFFRKSAPYEALLVGSVNLTTAAHSGSNNFETAFLIELEPEQAPEWWLVPDEKQPTRFEDPQDDDQPIAASRLTALEIRYYWDRERGEARWGDPSQSPTLQIDAQGSPLLLLDPLPPKQWVTLSPEHATALRSVLPSTSFLTVCAEGEDSAVILVAEEGMTHKPSLFLSLSAADILRYWALLTSEQKAAFLEERAAEIPSIALAMGIDFQPPLIGSSESMFAVFANIYQAFGSLERDVANALETGRESTAVYRLFGAKYDSLGRLLARVTTEESDGDPVRGYLVILCAQQLLAEVRRSHPEFLAEHEDDLERLNDQLRQGDSLKSLLRFPPTEDRDAFIEWFEPRFLRRAHRAEMES